MKKIKITSTLFLGKEILARLTGEEIKTVNGGATVTTKNIKTTAINNDSKGAAHTCVDCNSIAPCAN